MYFDRFVKEIWELAKSEIEETFMDRFDSESFTKKPEDFFQEAVADAKSLAIKSIKNLFTKGFKKLGNGLVSATEDFFKGW